MLIIPLTGKLSRHNLPLATLVIILLNIVIYFTIQWDDRKYYVEAQKIYYQSGLSDIEMQYYLSYRYGKEKPVPSDSTLSEDREKQKYLREMMKDGGFQSKLSGNQLIHPNDPQFEKWRELRDRYDIAIARVTAWKYGFIPDKHQPFTIISHMFLHGSWEHLLGNMLFLWLVGCALELGLGRLNYMVLYGLGGIFAVGLFYVCNMKSAIPLIGASGAIAGLMGAYTVAYGKTKINVFYSLGFYFNYTKIYAIALLPAWIGYEVYQLIFEQGSSVAYLAHIGGLASGIVAGYASIKWFKKKEHKVFEADPQEKIKPLRDEALKKKEILDMTSARRLLMEIMKIDASNEDALKHLYDIDKLQPKTMEFHQTASKRLAVLSRKQGDDLLLTETFADYSRRAGKPKLNPDLLIVISDAFARLGKMDEAEALIGYVFSVAPRYPKLSTRLMEMAWACHKKGRYDLRDRMVKVILDHFPESYEAGQLKKGRLHVSATP